jgi:fucose permease
MFARAQYSDRAITVAMAVFFFTFGFSSAIWVVRIPEVRALVHVNTAILGILFLTGAIGALLSLIAAPLVISRLSTRAGVWMGFTCYAVGTAGAGFALIIGDPYVLGISNFVSGIGAGLADVSVNVESAELEKRAGRALLPQLHGAFSFGTLAGALLGSLTISWSFPLATQSFTVGIFFLAVLALFFRYIPRGTGQTHGEHATAERALPGEKRKNWSNPRLILLGLAIFGGSVAEGGANDWLALAMVDDYKISGQTAAITFAVLVAAMTITRLSGGTLIDRFGRVRTLRFFAVLGLAGVLLVILGAPLAWVAWVGAALWGVGVALVFPVIISAAADGPNSSSRVAVVTAFGYSAFLVAPPLLGFLAQSIGLLNMFWVFIGLLGLLFVAAGAAKPLQDN